MTFDTTGGAATGEASAAPVCPRHPGTVSYVRCQRCERPVCPACQRPAAVGVQCVDCVREQGRSVRAPRTPFGGRVTSARPVVTQSIIGICAVAFLLQWTRPGLTDRLSFLPYEAVAEPYRFLTAAFVHSPSFLPHILLNLYALWMLGPYLEQLLGPVRFAALYLVSALGSSVSILLLASPEGDTWVTHTVGASGAVFGLFSAIVILNRRLGRDSSAVIGVIVVNLAFGFWPGLGISWQGHLGGLVTGALVSLALSVRAPDGTATAVARRTQLQVAGLAGVLVLLVVLTVLKVVTVPSGLLA